MDVLALYGVTMKEYLLRVCEFCNGRQCSCCGDGWSVYEGDLWDAALDLGEMG